MAPIYMQPMGSNFLNPQCPTKPEILISHTPHASAGPLLVPEDQQQLICSHPASTCTMLQRTFQRNHHSL